MDDIAKLNDRFRQQLGMPVFENIVPGKACMSAGVAALPPEMQIAIWSEVRGFERFTGACRKLWRRPRNGLCRPQFYAL